MDIERKIRVFKSNNMDFVAQIASRAEIFRQLLDEAIYYLAKALKDERIAVAQMCGRIKDVDSACRKQIRKKYKDPLNEIEDFVGVRIICLFTSQMNEIDLLIKKHFNVSSVSEKRDEKKLDQFGYMANHYIVRLPRHFSGPRYDEIKDQCLEIQVKTLLQDSWATINHKLTYKNESVIPEPIQRAFSAIAGTLEILDSQFDNLRSEVEAHLRSIAEARKIPEILLSQPTDEASLKNYLSIKFPDWNLERLGRDDLAELVEYKYRTIADVDSLIDRTHDAVAAYMRKYGGGADLIAPHFSLAMTFDKLKYRMFEYIGSDAIARFEEFDNLVDAEKPRFLKKS